MLRLDCHSNVDRVLNFAISFFQELAHNILHIATTFGSEAFLNAIDDEKQALLDILIDNEFKDCVSHSNVQSYLSDLWNGRAAIITIIGYPKYIVYPKKILRELSQPAITCSKLTIETLEQGVKYVQS